MPIQTVDKVILLTLFSFKEFEQKYFYFGPSINWDKKLPLNIDFTR